MTKKWIDREFKNRNKEGTGEDQHLPIMYPHLWAWICHFPPDGDVTMAMDFTKEEAYRKWEALTLYYESQLENV